MSSNSNLNLANDSGMDRLTTLASCEGEILRILCNSEKEFMIVVTDKGLLYHFVITFTNGVKLKEVTKMKLAVGLTSQPSLTWAGDNVLALATGNEPMVRLWDVEQADNYTLVPNLTQCDVLDKSIKVLQVAYSTKHQILAAGLSNGMVAFWQFGNHWSVTQDLGKLLQSDPTWNGDQSSQADLAWSDVFTEGMDQEGANYGISSSHRGSLSGAISAGPEANWHPQPTAILTSRPEDEFNTGGFMEASRHVQVLAWDGTQERLAIAVSARSRLDNSLAGHGFVPKCATYVLERQPLCGLFGGQGCAVVQTGPRSLAMLTATQTNPITDPVKLNTEQEGPDGPINPLAVPTSGGLPAAFIATSTTFVSGGSSNFSNMVAGSDGRLTQRSECGLLSKHLAPDQSSLIPLVREHEAQVEDQIRALYCTPEHVSYWNGLRVSTFKHATGDCIVHFASFPCEFPLVGMHDQFLFTTEPYKLQVRNLQGSVKQLINFSEVDGSVVRAAQCASRLLCLTDRARVRIFDLSKRELKTLSSSKSLTELTLSTVLISNHILEMTGAKKDVETFMTASASTNELRISSIAVNQTGDAISFGLQLLVGGAVAEARWPNSSNNGQNTMQGDSMGSEVPKLHQKSLLEEEQRRLKDAKRPQSWISDTRLYVYHLDRDKLQYFDFSSTSAEVTMESLSSKVDCTRARWPRRHYWDQFDPRLLAVEAAPLPTDHPFHCVSARDSSDGGFPTGHVESQGDSGTRPITPAIGRNTTASRASSALGYTSSKRPDRSKMSTWPTLIVSLFTSSEQSEPIIQEHFVMAPHHSALLGLEVPYFYFAVRGDLIYRLVNEQGQRRRQMVTDCRQLVSDASGAVPSHLFDLTDPLPTGDTQSGINNLDSHTPNGVLPPAVDTNNSASGKIHYINRRVMRDFIDLEQADSHTREAMLSFSYYLTMGEMDAAFKAMKFIKSPIVWQNVVRMCVSTCRLDVARVCLGKMGNAMAALMVREARSREPEVEAQAGELALQLGMTQEAERLFTKCGRWDLVIRMYQALGQWDRALRAAASHNRIALRATHYAYAKELEANGRLKQAIEHYKQSETHRFEVPRMLKSRPDTLESFVTQQQDKSVYRWWAQTLESEGRLDEARGFYVKAEDYLSLVRVLCCLGQNEDAEVLCNETGDPAACYHLARQLESSGAVDQAIRLFTRAKAYSSAVRLCKDHGRNDHLYSLAQLGRPTDMLEAAAHLESIHAYANKAVLLYQKAGHIGRAVELAFQTHQFAALQTVAASLDDRIDPVLLKRCGDFFVKNNQFDRAVDVLAAGRQYWDALRICAEFNVPISEELAEKLSPIDPTQDTCIPPATTTTNGGAASKFDEADRTSVLVELGELCLNQGLYHLACKKFTQAGSRISAMKALLRSGDTEKIVFFANVSKQKEIYVMAANYLQTLEGWRTDVDTMRTIVQFYTRGRAPESLASFFEACAHAEIEDLGSYEKAAAALTEAYKVLHKAISSAVNESAELRLQKRLAQIKHKATLCREYAETQLLFTVDPIEAMRNCQALLENAEPGDIVRPGDIYADMIREFVVKEKFKAALACMQEMRERLEVSNQSITRYIDRQTLEKLRAALNLPLVDDTASTENTPESRLMSEHDGQLLDSSVMDDGAPEMSVSEATDEDEDD